MVYCASSLALAALEVLVHLPPQMRRGSALPDLTAIGLEVPDAGIAALAEPLPAETVQSRDIGDIWLTAAAALGLSVPSAIILHERNLLLNPRHPEMPRVTVVVQERFSLDARLFG